eukprot:Hpha_TRINITY_DN15637_c0_g1::TRINITY_DN15637_c0_g1_i4::g.98499::m.98499/K10884/XRCC6, KU70, G22P1; ATP-dependent DNA helicase 2 subunit 1
MAIRFDDLCCEGLPDPLDTSAGRPTAESGALLDPFAVDGGLGDMPATQPAELPERDALMILLDCQSDMFVPDAEGVMPFDLAVECLEVFYKNAVLRSERDQQGLLLYGSREMLNIYDFPGIYLFHELSAPSAPRVKELRTLRTARADFDTHVGSAPSGKPFRLDDALWAVLKIFMDHPHKFATKRLVIFTGDDNPCRGDAVIREKCFARARDLQEAGVVIEVQSTREGLPHQRESASPPGGGGPMYSGSTPMDAAKKSGDAYSLSLRPQFGMMARGPSLTFGSSGGHGDTKRLTGTGGTREGSSGGGVVSLTPADMAKSFDSDIFWRHLVYMGDAAYAGRRLIGLDARANARDLVNSYRVRAHPKRSQGRLNVRFGKGAVSFAVGLYNPIRRETRPTAVQVESLTSGEVRSSTRLICKDTADVLESSDLRLLLPIGRTDSESVTFTVPEVQALRADFGETGIRILGFKPLARLKLKYHMGPCMLLRPDDSIVTHSASTYTALWQSLRKSGKFALAEIIARKGGTPRLYGLVAEKDTALHPDEDWSGGLLNDGIYAVPLPYADDLRDLRLPPPATLSDPDRLKRQVDLAKRFMRKMWKAVHDPRDITNPALQQHYMVLQSLALDEATPGEIDDLTLPDLGYMKGSGLGKMFGELRRAVYPDGYCAQAMIGAPLKRPAITAGPGSPKAPRIDVSAYDFDALVRDHKLNKLTVPELKQHLSDLGLSRIGVKAALIAR